MSDIMGSKESKVERPSSTPKESQVETPAEKFRNFGFSLGEIVEQRLGIPMARMTSPKDLALIGASVYARDQVQPVITDPQAHTREVAKDYSQDFYKENETTSEEFEDRYPTLIGKNGDLAKGEIAAALRTASQEFNPQRQEALENNFAALYTLMLIAEPQLKTELIDEPGVKIDRMNNMLRLGHRETFQLDKAPDIVVEYGPGLAGVRKIPEEVGQTPLSLFIEKNLYVSKILVTLAEQYNFVSGRRFIGRGDGIEEAGEMFLEGGLEGRTDLVIASMVHSAGEKELIAGIRQGKELLRPGGLFVVKAPMEVKPEEMTGEDMLREATETFGKPELYHEFSYEDKREGGYRDAYFAVFRKAA